MRVRACRVYSAIDAVHVLNWHQWAVCMTFLVAMIFISARKSNSLWFFDLSFVMAGFFLE